jgi:regulatory protein
MTEQCTYEMDEKMRRWQLPEDERRRVIDRLTEERFIDEERYCRFFVRDKIRQNKWGRRKVEQALYMKRIPEDRVARVLDEVDRETYIEILRPLLQAKRKTVKANSDYELECKLIRFALSRGFSVDEARESLYL